MKFTKEQLSEALKAKVAEELLTDRTLKETSEVLYGFVGEEDELEDFVKKSIPMLKSFEGQARKQKSDYEKEKLEWEKNHHDKDDNKDNKDDKKGDDSKLDKLLEEIQALKSEREQERVAKTISEKRNSLKAALKKNGVNDDEWIEDRLQDLHIEKDTDVDSISDRWVKAYNKKGAGTPPNITPNTAGGGKEDLKHEFDDIAEGLKD